MTKIKLFSVFLAVLLLMSTVSSSAFEYAPEENLGTEHSETTAPAEIEAETGSGTEETETEEIETVIFEYSEDVGGNPNARVIPPGMEDLQPPESDSTTEIVTSAILPDGVYAIESVYAPDLWVDVNSTTSAGIQVWQDYHYSYPTNTFTRSALFKIKYVSTTQSYIIRLMTNNMLTLGFDDSGHLITKTLSSPYDSAIQPSETFTITRVSGAYVIQEYGETTSKALASKTNAGGINNIPDSYLEKEYTGTAQDKAKWNFYKYTGVDRHGMIVSYPASLTSIGIPVGSTGTMQNKTWSTVIGSNIPYMQTASGSSDLMSTSFNSTTGEMSYTALSPGYATIQAKILKDSNSTSQYSENKYFQVIPQEGMYFIKNVGTGMYMEVESPYTNDGSAIQQSYFYAEYQQRWIIEHATGGYVRIKSAISNKYLGIVETNGTYSCGQYSEQADYTLWKFNRTNNGNLKLLCKSYSSTLALATPSNLYGADLALVSYTNDSDYKDEWNIDIRKASLIALPESYNRSDYFDDVQSWLDEIGYINSYNNHATIGDGITKSEMLDYMKTSQITLIRTHGSKTSIAVTGGSLKRSDLLVLPNNYLSNSDLIIYGSCLTAQGGITDNGNLVNATLSAGARTVIGFQDSVAAGACNYWCISFFGNFVDYYFNDTKTLLDVCVAADDYVRDNCSYYEYYDSNGTLVSVRNYVIAGNTNIPK